MHRYNLVFAVFELRVEPRKVLHHASCRPPPRLILFCLTAGNRQLFNSSFLSNIFTAKIYGSWRPALISIYGCRRLKGQNSKLVIMQSIFRWFLPLRGCWSSELIPTVFLGSKFQTSCCYLLLLFYHPFRPVFPQRIFL